MGILLHDGDEDTRPEGATRGAAVPPGGPASSRGPRRTDTRRARAARSSRRTPRALVTALALACTALAPSCSLLVDKNAIQCETNEDCSAFAGTVCRENACVSATEPGGCTTNADCLASVGEFTICKKSERVCVPLLSAECTTVAGDYADDAAFLIGSVLPTSGPDASTGRTIENAIRLAIEDFNETTNGLPPAPGQTARRPIALVGCTDKSDADTAVRAAKHLVNVGVPAIVGAAFSGITIKMATEATIPAGALIISPSATSVALTDLADDGLVWRTSPSDVFQADALALFVPQLEARVRQELGLQNDAPIKVAIAHKGDAYGSGLGKALEKILQMNGKPALDPANADYYRRFDYGNPDDATSNPPKYGDVVAKILELKPHVTLVFGTNEGVENVFQAIEKQWDGPPQVPYRSQFLFSDGGLINQLWELVGEDADLRQRVFGTVPGTNNLLFTSFKSNYTTRFTEGDPAIFGAAGGYDATYLLAYALVALGAEPPTGKALAGALARMIPPAQKKIDVGTEDINKALPSLAAGENIDFNGASGPLDFDPDTGEAPSDIQIWCLPESPSTKKATTAVSSGLFYSATDKKLVGEIGTICE